MRSANPFAIGELKHAEPTEVRAILRFKRSLMSVGPRSILLKNFSLYVVSHETELQRAWGTKREKPSAVKKGATSLDNTGPRALMNAPRWWLVVHGSWAPRRQGNKLRNQICGVGTKWLENVGNRVKQGKRVYADFGGGDRLPPPSLSPDSFQKNRVRNSLHAISWGLFWHPHGPIVHFCYMHTQCHTTP